MGWNFARNTDLSTTEYDAIPKYDALLHGLHPVLPPPKKLQRGIFFFSPEFYTKSVLELVRQRSCNKVLDSM